MYILCAVVIVSAMFCVTGPRYEAGYLTSTRRFNLDNYDYYFYCSITCNGVFLWSEFSGGKSDGGSLSHTTEEQQVGYVKSTTHNQVECVSIILKNSSVNESRDITALLLLHYNTTQENIKVVCECDGETKEANNTYPSPIVFESDKIKFISRDNFITDYDTSIFMCEGNQRVSWMVNDEIIGDYSNSSEREEQGTRNTRTQPNNDSIIYTRTLLLNNETQLITLLILNSFNEMTVNVSCQSDGLRVTPNEPTTIMLESATTPSEYRDIVSTSTGNSGIILKTSILSNILLFLPFF